MVVINTSDIKLIISTKTLILVIIIPNQCYNHFNSSIIAKTIPTFNFNNQILIKFLTITLYYLKKNSNQNYSLIIFNFHLDFLYNNSSLIIRPYYLFTKLLSKINFIDYLRLINYFVTNFFN